MAISGWEASVDLGWEPDLVNSVFVTDENLHIIETVSQAAPWDSSCLNR